MFDFLDAGQPPFFGGQFFNRRLCLFGLFFSFQIKVLKVTSNWIFGVCELKNNFSARAEKRARSVRNLSNKLDNLKTKIQSTRRDLKANEETVLELASANLR